VRTLREDEPARGVALPVAPGIRRIVAANPGPMTYHGTNTYLLDWDDGVAVLDPGPDDMTHVRQLLAAAGAPIRAVLLTHTHRDHWGALAALLEATGAPLYAWRTPAEAAVRPDVPLADGDMAGRWRAVHTPGHAPDHVCFFGPDGALFSGDHVMGWSTTVVGGPGGDMAAYCRSLERLIGLGASLYLPGHGPPITDPAPYAAALLTHRRMREAAIVQTLGSGPASSESLVAALYPGLEPSLRRAAEGSVLAHLRKLADEGRAAETQGGWQRTG